MVGKDKQTTTILVTVFEGRYFRKRSSSKLYVQCRFNNEILTTSPVDHEIGPIWDTELAWEIDNKVLGFLRSQRASLKLICHSIDVNNRRDTLGYIVLDIRAGSHAIPAIEKWYPLINSKQSGAFRPEIKLSFGITSVELPPVLKPLQTKSSSKPNTTTSSTTSGTVNSDGKITSNTTGSSSVTKTQLVSSIARQQVRTTTAQLSPLGFYQINDGKSGWILSVTLAFAENLALLSPDMTGKFNFCFMFLDQLVNTESFLDLANPSFPAERISIRLRGSFNDIIKFLTELSKFVVYLCCDNRMLGYSDVPLAALLMPGSEGQTVEKVYNVFNLNKDLPISHDAQVPSIGLSLSLMPQEQNNDPPAQEQQDNTSNLAITHQTHVDLTTSYSGNGVEEGKQHKSRRQDGEAERDRPARSQHSRTGTAGSIGSRSPNKYRTDQFVAEDGDYPRKQEQSLSFNPLSPNMTHNWTQYRMSIDLRSIRDFRLSSAKVYLKYTYLPFGTSSPILTHPATDLTKGTNDVLLPHSFCAFEFVMNSERLQTYLEGVPLTVEIWHKDTFLKDSLLGTATVDLSDVWKAPAVADVEELGLDPSTSGTIRTIESFVDVTGASNFKKIAELRIALALEDFGVVAEPDQQELQENAAAGKRSYSKTVQFYGGSEHMTNRETDAVGGIDDGDESVVSVRETPEYKIALELELWKRAEEEKFMEALKEKERISAQKLSEEWKKRERDRDEILKRKVDDFKTLEQQMQKLLLELEDREKLVEAGEHHLGIRRQDLERDYNRQLEEARDASRRLHDEYKHMLDLEKQKTAEADHGKQRALKEKDEIESKYKRLENEYMDFKKSLNHTPEAALKSETNRVKADYLALQQRAEQLEKSKKQYKSQWIKALKELTRIKQRRQEEEEDFVRRQKQELDSMKLKFMLNQDNASVHDDLKALGEIKRDLNELKLKAGGDGRKGVPTEGSPAINHYHHIATAPSSPVKLKEGLVDVGSVRENINPKALAEVERLARERDGLLGTGVYTKEDVIVHELEKRIRTLLAEN